MIQLPMPGPTRWETRGQPAATGVLVALVELKAAAGHAIEPRCLCGGAAPSATDDPSRAEDRIHYLDEASKLGCSSPRDSDDHMIQQHQSKSTSNRLRNVRPGQMRDEVAQIRQCGGCLVVVQQSAGGRCCLPILRTRNCFCDQLSHAVRTLRDEVQACGGTDADPGAQLSRQTAEHRGALVLATVGELEQVRESGT